MQPLAFLSRSSLVSWRGQPSDGVLCFLFSLQLSVEGLSLCDQWLVLVLPVETSQHKATAKSYGDVSDDFSSQSTGDGGDGRHCD